MKHSVIGIGCGLILILGAVSVTGPVVSAGAQAIQESVDRWRRVSLPKAIWVPRTKGLILVAQVGISHLGPSDRLLRRYARRAAETFCDRTAEEIAEAYGINKAEARRAQLLLQCDTPEQGTRIKNWESLCPPEGTPESEVRPVPWRGMELYCASGVKPPGWIRWDETKYELIPGKFFNWVTPHWADSLYECTVQELVPALGAPPEAIVGLMADQLGNSTTTSGKERRFGIRFKSSN